MATPYVTPEMITNAPTGVPWSIIPFPKATTQAQLAEQTNICWRASSMVDAICNQPLRATLNAEAIPGPDYRMTVNAAGVARAMTSRWPVLQILGGRVSPQAAIPRSWATIPTSAMTPELPPMTGLSSVVEGADGAGGQAVLVAPGYVSWLAGRNGYVLELIYLNGWAHAGITANATAGATTLAVDDVTAFATASAFIYDGASTETVTVTSVAATSPVPLPTGGTAQTGPGTLTLSGPLAYAHNAGVVVSAMPQDIPWAATLLAASQVLDSGATSITIQNVQGSETTGGKGIEELKTDAELLLAPYARRL